jgi:hypothetical protein
LLRVGQNLIAQPGCLYVREAVARPGGLARTLGLAFDVALHLDLASGAVYCPFTLAKVRFHDSRLTTIERDASLAEFERAVWGRAGHSFRSRLLRRCQPMLALGGRLYYRFHRSY